MTNGNGTRTPAGCCQEGVEAPVAKFLDLSRGDQNQDVQCNVYFNKAQQDTLLWPQL